MITGVGGRAMTDEERDVQAFCNAVFKGELTLTGKINFLMFLEQKYRTGVYAGLAETLKKLSLLTQEEVEKVMWDSWHAIEARRGEKR